MTVRLRSSGLNRDGRYGDWNNWLYPCYRWFPLRLNTRPQRVEIFTGSSFLFFIYLYSNLTSFERWNEIPSERDPREEDTESFFTRRQLPNASFCTCPASQPASCRIRENIRQCSLFIEHCSAAGQMGTDFRMNRNDAFSLPTILTLIVWDKIALEMKSSRRID